MHQAPAVRVAVGRSRWHLGFIACGGAVAIAGAAAFAGDGAQAAWRVSVVFFLALAAPLLALQGWWCSPVGYLGWDGQHWLWSDAAGLRELRLVHFLDWQRCMLVRLDADNGRPLWLWLQPASRADTAWLPLRRAIVSSLLAGRQVPTMVQPGTGGRLT